MNKRISKIAAKGFALTQVLLALAISSIVVAGVVYHYNSVSKNQAYTNVADNIVNNTEISLQEKVINTSSNNNFNENGYAVAIAQGSATITNLDSSGCSAISSALKAKGTVTASCNSATPTNNTITFAPANLAASKNQELPFNGGVADPGATNSVTAPNLTGIFVAGGTGVAAGSTKTFTPITPGTPITNPGVINGNNGALGGGGSAAPSGGTTPISVTGSSSLACAYYLTQPGYQTTSLGTRTTSCPSGYVSTANQTGTRTWACASPTAAALPVSTDTWTGGACTLICVPQATKYQSLGCPTGYTGAISQDAVSTCATQTSTPTYGPWTTYSNTCVLSAPPAPTYTAEQVCGTIGVNIVAGCAAGLGLSVFESPNVWTGGSFTATIHYNGATATDTVYAGQYGPTSKNFVVGGGTFTLTATASITDNCPQANPAFAGSCIDRVSGSITGP